MKNSVMPLALIAAFFFAAHAENDLITVINNKVPEYGKSQEKMNWCWAAATQAIFKYNKKDNTNWLPQCTIALYAFPQGQNLDCHNPPYLDNGKCIHPYCTVNHLRPVGKLITFLSDTLLPPHCRRNSRTAT